MGIKLPLNIKITLVIAIPVGGASGFDVKHYHAFSIHAVFKPAAQFVSPAFFEFCLVADDFGFAFNRYEYARCTFGRWGALYRKADLSIRFDVVHHPAVFPSEIIAIAVKIDLPVVAHWTCADLAIGRVCAASRNRYFSLLLRYTRDAAGLFCRSQYVPFCKPSKRVNEIAVPHNGSTSAQYVSSLQHSVTEELIIENAGNGSDRKYLPIGSCDNSPSETIRAGQRNPHVRY